MVDIIKLDPHWNHGQYTSPPTEGLRLAGKHYFSWTVTDAYIAESDYNVLEREATAAADWFASWDAWSLLKRYQASSKHDVSACFDGLLANALSRVTANILVLPCTTERLLSVEGAQQLAQGLTKVTYAPVDSKKGHLAWRAVPGSSQTQFINQTIRDFLKHA
jgi:homoserine O-acetyltransferase